MVSPLPDLSLELMWCISCCSISTLILLLKYIARISLNLAHCCSYQLVETDCFRYLRSLDSLSTAIICRNRYLEDYLLERVPTLTSHRLNNSFSPSLNSKETNTRQQDSNSILMDTVSQILTRTQAHGTGIIDLESQSIILSSNIPEGILTLIIKKSSELYESLESLYKEPSLPSFQVNAAADLQFYGVSLITYLPISWVDGSKKRLGVIWITYKAAQRPTKLDIATLESLWQGTQQQLANLETYSQIDHERLQAQAISDERLKFISHLSHDLRTPLANIQNLFYLLLSKIRQQKGIPYSEISELLELGINNCVRLNSMLSDILDFTKHQAGRLKATPVKTQLKQLIHELLSENSLRAAQQEVQFILDDQPFESVPPLGSALLNDWGEVFVDSRHLKRILLNLVSNAINHCPRGKVKISCKGSLGSHLILEIVDNGPGIPQGKLQTIFNPYSNSSQSGYGLGLTLSKGLAELNGIDLKVNSTLGKGTTVTLLLPKHEL